QLEHVLGVPADGCAPDRSAALQVVHCLGYCYTGPAALDGDQPRSGPDLADQIAGTAPAHAPEALVTAATAPVVLRGIVSGEPAWQVWRQVLAAGQPSDVPGGRHPSAERIRAEVERAGLRGRGGAGFPASRKWLAVAEARSHGPRYVVANGDEGDPGSYADRVLMERDPGRVLEGLALAALACRATQAFVYVRSEYPRAFESVSRAIADAYGHGHLGRDIHGSGVDLDVSAAAGAGSYVAGEETSLLHSLAGLRATVRPRPPYPVEHGLLGRPTAVNNIETLAAVPAIVAEGGASYAARGVAAESGTMLVCLNERFRSPGAYEVELGTPLRDLVDGLGGGLTAGRRLRALQVGGPLGGFLGPDQLDLPLSDSALTAAGATLGHGSLIAIDDQIASQDLLAHLWRFGAKESCGTCTPCREGTRRGERDPVTTTADERLLDTMEVASLCPFGRRIPRAIRSLLQVYGTGRRSVRRPGEEPT
ncbi:MAG TPA: NADH-ubiquinone oxidoreductase-F iron-sulfur binding region domain-containing protein, partial [Actinopolymorphaceae bacterium]|nr:NADH-ubiquinone oxidoreductase-F iron-sulfur binding region domain-containing protein [Actinopolymorphaceae bacterium]